MTENKQNLSPLFRIVKTVLKNRKILLIFNSTVAVLSIIILLLIPNEYKSTALILIEDNAGMMVIPSILKDMPFDLGFGGGTEVLRYKRLAESKMVLNSLIEKFDLDSLYDTEFREDTYEIVLGNLEVIDNEDGTISILYISEDRNLAAQIVSEIFNLVKELDINLSNQSAKSFRKFIEARNVEAFGMLSLYEDSLKEYSEQTGMINVEEQLKQSIKVMSAIESQKMELEIQREFLKHNVSSDANTIAHLDGQINAINTMINELKQTNKHMNIPLDDLPEQTLQYLRLFRNLKIQESIIEFLVPQVENAKIEEKKNFSSLILVDKPVPSMKKTRPVRSKILIVIMFLSGLISVLGVRLYEVLKYNKELLKESID